MKTVIHPNYKSLTSEILALRDGDYTPVKTFCNNRNTVELINIDGEQFVLKKYKKTNLLTGIIYTFFRKTKARRAYEYALMLLEMGIDTPFPVAYCEKRHLGIFRWGYFISKYTDRQAVADYFYSDKLDDNERKLLANDISLYTLQLHQNGVIPLDYNATNILLKKESDGHYHFTLIDINRMKFGRVPNLKEAMSSFFQIGSFACDYLSLLEPYTTRRGFDFEEALYHVTCHSHNQTRLLKFKHLFKRDKR